MSENKQLAVSNPSALISKAIESNLDLDKLERLMDLQERWEANQAKKSFFDAMARFQSEKPEIKRKDGVSHDNGQTYKYHFAKLPYIQKLIDPVLSKNGLSYSFRQEQNEGRIRITCVVRHIDGHSEETWLESEKDSSGGKNGIQAIGSAVSYLMRYTFKNAFGLSEGDDDGVNTQLTSGEIEELALDKLKRLRDEKGGGLDENLKARLDTIINDKESSSYKKAIKTLEEL